MKNTLYKKIISLVTIMMLMLSFGPTEVFASNSTSYTHYSYSGPAAIECSGHKNAYSTITGFDCVDYSVSTACSSTTGYAQASASVVCEVDTSVYVEGVCIWPQTEMFEDGYISRSASLPGGASASGSFSTVLLVSRILYVNYYHSWDGVNGSSSSYSNSL